MACSGDLDLLDDLFQGKPGIEQLLGVAVLICDREDLGDEVSRLQARDDFNKAAKQELATEVLRLRAEMELDEIDTHKRLSAANSALCAALQQNADLAAEMDRLLVAPPRKGENRPNRPKLTPGDVITIRNWHALGRTTKNLAEQYRVHPSTISRIVNGKAYSHG